MSDSARRVPAYLAVLLAACPLGANAMDEGFYMGALYADVKDDSPIGPYDALMQDIVRANGFSVVENSPRIDVTDRTWGFIVGHRTFSYLAFEGTYILMSDVRYRTNGTFQSLTTPENGTTPFDFSVKTRLRGPALSVLGILPISYEFELFGRAGALIGSSTIDVIGFADTKTSVDWLAGAGAAYTFLDVYTVRLEYQRIFDAGHEDRVLFELDLDSIQLNILVTF